MPNNAFGLLMLKTKPADPADTLARIRELLTTGATISAPPAEEPPESPPSAGPVAPIPGVSGTPPSELIAAIERYFPPSEWLNAINISRLESGWRATARNNTLDRGPCGTRYFIQRLGIWAQTEDSIGYFQVNRCAHGNTVEYWENADNNARFAYALWRAGGWSGPWAISAGTLGLR